MKRISDEWALALGWLVLIAFLLGLALFGCGNGSGSSPRPGLQPPATPAPVTSAVIDRTSTQTIWRNYTKVYFINTTQGRNTGEADLANAYYRIEGEDKYWGWTLMAVSLPFNLPAGASLSVTTEFSYWLNDILLVTGPNLPKDYGVRVILCMADGTPLDTMTATVVIP